MGIKQKEEEDGNIIAVIIVIKKDIRVPRPIGQYCKSFSVYLCPPGGMIEFEHNWMYEFIMI